MTVVRVFYTLKHEGGFLARLTNLSFNQEAEISFSLGGFVEITSTPLFWDKCGLSQNGGV